MTVRFCFSPPPQGVVGDRPDWRCPGLRALGWLAAQLHEQPVSDRLHRFLTRTVPTTLTPLSRGQEILVSGDTRSLTLSRAQGAELASGFWPNDGAAHADGVGSGGMSVSPPLFSRIPGALFGPLAGGHATLYWAMLSTFYHHEFEREPFFLVRSVVVDTTEELVRESSLWSERREELLALGEKPDVRFPPWAVDNVSERVSPETRIS